MLWLGVDMGGTTTAGTLSIPHALFRILEKKRGHEVEWWSSAGREVRAMAQIIPLLYAAVGSPLSKIIWATDARGSEQGDAGALGIVAAVVDEMLAERIYEAGRAVGFSVPVIGKQKGRNVRNDP